MGILDYLSDLMPAFVTEADAESPTSPTRGGVTPDSPASGTNEQSDEEKEVNVKDAKSDDGEEATGHKPGDKGDKSEGEDEAPAAEEEGEEEEPQDLKPKLEEECMHSKQCAPLKHHYDDCSERVKKQIEEKGKAEEDCVEEFFHLMHCAAQCAAPKLFRQLK